jgi:hypothetical protein
MENTEAIWQQRLAKRREGIPWKVIIEAEGFKYGGTFTGQLKKARQRGWIPPEESLPPAIRRDGRRVWVSVPTEETGMSEATVEMSRDADTVPDPPVSAVADIAAVSEISEPLSLAETQTLEHYEAIITQGFKTFVEVGQALTAIRDQRLYRQSHGTFEDYLRHRWDLSRPYAYQLMDASEVVKNLSATADILPVTETQARPLASLPPEQQPEVWQEVVETAPAGKVTAKHVQATVKRAKVTGTTPPRAPTPKAPKPFDVQDIESKIKALYMEWLKHCETDDALETAQFFLNTLSDLAQGRGMQLQRQ